LVLSTAVTASSAQRIHTVASGQTLGGIAKRYGISVSELREANQLPRGTVLKLGQRLLVPSPGEVERLKHLQSKTTSPTHEDTSNSAETNAESTDSGTPQVPAPSNEEVTPKPDVHAEAAPIEATNPTDAEPAPQDTPAPKTQTPSEKPTVVPSAVTSSAKKKRAALVGNVERQSHTVASGHTLGKIAKRYRIKIESLCGANGLDRHANLKIGQKLVIPNGDDDPIVTLGPDPSDVRDRDEKNPSSTHDSNGIQELSVPGAGPVYYYEPTGAGRQSMRPIVVYLHGRGGDAEADCRRWSRIARRFGWLLCPSGPMPHNSGRSWNNNWVSGQNAVMGAVQALRNLYGRRVQLYGNTLIGFSEGAYVAMNVGVRQPRTFNRWLILGADVSYWGGAGLEALKDAKSKVRRVVLITGGRDQVVDDTRTVAGWLEDRGVPIRIQTPGDLAHEVAIDRMPEMYVSALNWLDNAGPVGKSKKH
jgi:LysM repeat protein/predicted esterase